MRVDYKTSMITDQNPLRGWLFYWDLDFSLTLNVLKEVYDVLTILFIITTDGVGGGSLVKPALPQPEVPLPRMQTGYDILTF